MDKYKLQSPIGTHTGTKEQIRELAELYPEESLITHLSWMGTKTVAEVFPDQYKSPSIFWGGKWTMDRQLVQFENILRSQSSFDYIGPRISSSTLSLEEIIEQILMDVNETHMVSPSNHFNWQHWTQSSAVYGAVKKYITSKSLEIKIPSSDFSGSHKTVPLQPKTGQCWDYLCSVGIEKLIESKEAFPHPFRWDQNIFTFLRQFQEYKYGYSKIGRYYNTSPKILGYTTLSQPISRMLQELRKMMDEQLLLQKRFHFPNICTLRIKEKSNGAKYVSVSAVSKLKNCIHAKQLQPRDIGGDTTPVLSSSYWSVGKNGLGEEKKNLSKQRKLSLTIAQNCNIFLPEVHGFMCFLQKLIYVALHNKNSISIPYIGTFYTISQKKDSFVVRFHLYK